MEGLYILLGIGLLILNIVLLVYFFQACKDIQSIKGGVGILSKDIQSIKKGLGIIDEKDFYNQFLELISQGKHKEAAKILHKHVWKYSRLYQTSILTRQEKEKEYWAEYIKKYKDLFELVGEKPPTLLSTSIIKKAEILIKSKKRKF